MGFAIPDLLLYNFNIPSSAKSRLGVIKLILEYKRLLFYINIILLHNNAWLNLPNFL